jgi:hypothetical protein
MGFAQSRKERTLFSSFVQAPTEPVRSLQSRKRLVGSGLTYRLAHKRWDARAFTRRSDLLRNAQTLLSCLCARELLIYSCTPGKNWKGKAGLSIPYMNAGVLRPVSENPGSAGGPHFP